MFNYAKFVWDKLMDPATPREEYLMYWHQWNSMQAEQRRMDQEYERRMQQSQQ